MGGRGSSGGVAKTKLSLRNKELGFRIQNTRMYTRKNRTRYTILMIPTTKQSK